MDGGALVLTFDNLGEAAELERGQATEVPHPSVTVALPRVLDALEARGLRATFFLEAVNCVSYPDAVLEIAARGHEVAHHGWRHERWSGLPVARERSLLVRGLDAFAGLGVSVAGFRPPGGDLNRLSVALLREAGLRYCSVAGGAFGLRDGLAFVPFAWEFVDAFHLMERFSGLRSASGGSGAATSVSEVRRAWEREIDRLGAGEWGGFRTLVLHPFLMLQPGWFDCVCELLDRVCQLGVRVLCAREAALALT